ncbi:MAG: replication endonuclease, partial [Sinobacterium sp.]
MSIASIDQALSMTEHFGTHECHRFRERIFNTHAFLCAKLAKQYTHTANKAGHVKANQELRQFHQWLTLGPHFNGLFIDSNCEEVSRFAEQKTKELSRLFKGTKKRYKRGYALERLIKKLADCDLTLPIDDPYSAETKALAAAIARVLDPQWWRRQIRSRQDYYLEYVQINLNCVNHKAGIYSSDECVRRKLQQWQRNELILSGLEAENDLGDVFCLLDLAKRGVSNVVNRRNELMTRMRGFENYATAHGHTAVFYTITAPSRYHQYLSSPCIPNSKYKGASPSDTQTYFNTLFKRARAKLHRSGIHPYGFRVVEPHHDGTPHWHILFFMEPNQVSQTTEVLRHFALQEDGNESGASQYRFKAKIIDPAKGSATGYIAKYIAKNIDGYNVIGDHYGFDAIESAIRIRAWASNWNIRQFQQIGGPSVTVWREARRLAVQPNADLILASIDDATLNGITQAANNGDWCEYFEWSGGASTACKERPVRALHVKKELPNKYGEITKKIIGILLRSTQTIITRLRVWEVRSKPNT